MRVGDCMQLRSSSIKGSISNSSSVVLRYGRSRIRDDNKFVKRRIFQKGGRVIKVGDGSTRRSKWDPEESLCLLNACLLDKKSGKVQRRWNEIVKFMHAYHWNECTVENVGDRYRHLKAIYTAWTQIMLHVSGCAWDEQKGVYNFSPDQQRAFKQRFSHSRYTDICKGIPPTGLNIMVELWGDKVATGEYVLSPALVDGSSPNHRSTNNPDISRNDKEQMSQPSDSEPLDEGSGESNEAPSTDPISESRSSSTTHHTSSGNKRKSTDTPVNHQIEYSVELAKQSTEYFKLAKQSTEYFKLAKQSTEYFKLRQAEHDRSHERERRLYSEVQARLFSHPYTVGRGPRYCTGVMRKLKENNKQEEFLDTRDEFLQSWLEWEFDDTNIM